MSAVFGGGVGLAGLGNFTGDLCTRLSPGLGAHVVTSAGLDAGFLATGGAMFALDPPLFGGLLGFGLTDGTLLLLFNLPEDSGGLLTPPLTILAKRACGCCSELPFKQFAGEDVLTTVVSPEEDCSDDSELYPLPGSGDAGVSISVV